MSIGVKLLSGYRVSGQAQYLCYTTDRVNGKLDNAFAVLNDFPGYQRSWRLTEYKGSDPGVDSYYSLEALDTARDGMPPNPDPATYWKYAAWFLCLIGDAVVLSPVGQIDDTHQIDQSVAYWRMGTYTDPNGNSFQRFQPINYPGGNLSPNLDGDDRPDRQHPVGIRDNVPSKAAGAMDFYFESI